MESFIRNFVIIAHIDHGKSTLADRLLEITNTISTSKLVPQFLDKMNLERERGITIKMHPCRMLYHYDATLYGHESGFTQLDHKSNVNSSSSNYILNLIDTPGHVDFQYEVSRALAAVEGAILLVDATQGIQAQTLGNLYLAKLHNLKIIPVLNKIDLNSPDLDKVKQEVCDITEVNAEDVLMISAKTGRGVRELLDKIISEIPPAKKDDQNILRALIFDSRYDPYKGVLVYIRVFEGTISKNEEIYLMRSKTKTKIIDVGIFTPELVKKDKLSSGEIGWVATGLKEPSFIKVGDTLTIWSEIEKGTKIEPFPGYQEPQPMVFAGFYPENNDDFENFAKALSKLKLNDASLFYEPETNEALGRGFRLGFLGILHYEIISLRLQQEFNLNIITTTPTVPYKINLKNQTSIIINNPADFPSSGLIETIEEPYIEMEILSPNKYLNAIIKLMANYRGIQTDLKTLSGELLIIKYEMPLSEILLDLYDRLKSVSSGFASMNYKIIGYRQTDVKKMDVFIHREKIESLSFITPNVNLYSKARDFAQKLKNIIPRQNFPVAIQIGTEGEILARETIPSLKKDVTGYLYGGDRTRKAKLWAKQKRGKKRLSEFSRVHLSPDVYRNIFLNKNKP